MVEAEDSDTRPMLLTHGTEGMLLLVGSGSRVVCLERVAALTWVGLHWIRFHGPRLTLFARFFPRRFVERSTGESR